MHYKHVRIKPDKHTFLVFFLTSCLIIHSIHKSNEITYKMLSRATKQIHNYTQSNSAMNEKKCASFWPHSLDDMVHCRSLDTVNATFHSLWISSLEPWIAGVYRTRCMPCIWPLSLGHMESLCCHWNGTTDLKKEEKRPFTCIIFHHDTKL